MLSCRGDSKSPDLSLPQPGFPLAEALIEGAFAFAIKKNADCVTLASRDRLSSLRVKSIYFTRRGDVRQN